MTTGMIVGAVVGAAIGWMIGGPVGAFYGAGIGMAIGGYIDPLTADVAAPGQPDVGDLSITTATEGIAIPDVLGTTKLTGNIIWYCCDKTKAVTKKQKTAGKGGDSSTTVVTGYKCYMTWAMVLCLGPVDVLYTVYNGKKVVWDGELYVPPCGGSTPGEETITLTGMGSMTFYFGTGDSLANTVIGTKVANNIPYRNVCWAFFNDCLVGGTPKCPTMKFIIGKRPTYSFSNREDIGLYDYNPAQALWHTLVTLAKLPSSFLDATSFGEVASTLYAESRGISIYFSTQKLAETYLETILKHIDGSIRYSSDGTFHLILNRAVTIADLPTLSEDDILAPPTISRPSWLDTYNEVKVSYALRKFSEKPVCTESAPTLTQHPSCFSVQLLERQVRSSADTVIVVDDTGLGAGDSVTRIYYDFGGVLTTKTVSGFAQDTPCAGYDRITLSSDPELIVGDWIVLVTNVTTEFTNELEAIFHVKNGCPPFRLKRDGVMIKTVGAVFSWLCYPDDCDLTRILVEDSHA